jgi:MFS family permease
MTSTSSHYYGWRIVYALAITQTVGFGILHYAFSVFLEPMELSLGWSRGQVSGAFSLALLTSGIVALPIGRYVDKRGARLLMTLGSLAGALLVFSWASVTNLVVFYAIQAAIGVMRAATLYDIAFTVVAVWFRVERPKAMLIITFVAGLASTIFIPLTTFLVTSLGWRDALRVLAVILAVINIPLHGLILRRRPEQLGVSVDGQLAEMSPERPTPTADSTLKDVLRQASFWWLTAAVALDRLVLIAIAAHSVPLLMDKGAGLEQAAFIAGTIGLFQVAGRVVFVPMLRALPLTSLTVGVYGVRALALLLLFVPGFGWWLFAGLFGVANGASTLARAALIADIYGAKHYGSINGTVATVVALLQTISPVAAGLMFDAAGSYDPVVVALMVVSLLATGAMWVCTRRLKLELLPSR